MKIKTIGNNKNTLGIMFFNSKENITLSLKNAKMLIICYRQTTE